MGRKIELSAKERRDVVLMLLRKDESGGSLARRYGVSEATLYRWRDEFLQGGEQALRNGKKGNGEQRRIRELEIEIEKRDQVIGEMTIANRILKKRVGGLI